MFTKATMFTNATVFTINIVTTVLKLKLKGDACLVDGRSFPVFPHPLLIEVNLGDNHACHNCHDCQDQLPNQDSSRVRQRTFDGHCAKLYLLSCPAFR